MMKRIFAVLALVLSTGLLASPLTASAHVEDAVAQDVRVGDLVKTSDSSTVSYIAANGLRFAFPNAAVYKSWYGNDFSKVKVISKTQLSYRPLGGYVMFRPNTKLVQFIGSRDVYVVVKNNELRRLPSAAVANQVLGLGWTRNVEKLPARFGGAVKFGFDITAPGEYEPSKQTVPVEITWTTPLNMVVMR
jgi:hypothetical protein